jgi:hypothetical protein
MTWLGCLNAAAPKLAWLMRLKPRRRSVKQSLQTKIYNTTANKRVME